MRKPLIFLSLAIGCGLVVTSASAEEQDREDGVRSGESLEVTVQAEPTHTKVPEGATGTRLPISRREVPVTQSVLTAKELEARAITDLNTALQFMSAVTPVWEYGGFQFMTIRGFEDSLILRDFQRDDRSTFVTSAPMTGLWDVERIEMLKGPASVLVGYGALGGVVNLIRKRPSSVRRYEASASYGFPTQRTFTLGASGPILSNRIRFRLDVGHAYRSDYRGAYSDRTGGSLAIEWLPHDKHRFEARFSVNGDRYNTDTGLPTRNGVVPDAIPLSARLNTPQDFMDYHALDFSLDYESTPLSWLRIKNHFGIRSDRYAYFSAEVLRFAEDGTRIDREYFYLDRNWLPVSNTLELQARFRPTPSIVNHVGVGYDGNWTTSFHPRSAVWNLPLASLPIDALSPDPQPQVDIVRDAQDLFDQSVHGVFVHDHLSLPYGFHIDAGLRFDSFRRTRRRDQYDPATQVRTAAGDEQLFNAQALTYRAGILYAPVEQSSTYVSVSSSFRPNTTLGPDGQNYDPQRGLQLEAGQMFAWGKKLTGHAALFHITKSNVLYALGQDRFDLAGEVRSRGGEVEIEAQPVAWFAARASYSYTDARFVRFREGDAELEGKRPRLVADHTASAFVTTKPIPALSIAVGGRAIGTAFADNANTVRLPGYFLLDAHASYRIASFNVSLHCNNLLDQARYFTSSINGTQLTPGPRREVIAQLAWKQ